MSACECCGFEGAELSGFATYDKLTGGRIEDRLLCGLCSGSMASHAARHLDQQIHQSNVMVMQTLCYIGNAVIKAIQESKT